MRKGCQYHQAIQVDLQVQLKIFSKVGANIDYIEVSTNSFTGFIMEFTKTENILIIYKNPTLSILIITI